MLEFTCGCGQKLKVSNDLAGWSTQCTGCKELVPVPTLEAPAQAKAPPVAEVTIPWKGIAIGASCVALVAIIVAVLSGGSRSPDEDLAFANSKLKKQIADQQKELDELNAERSRLGDAAKLSDRARAAEAERDRLKRELQETQRKLDAARANAAPPPPEKPREAAPPPETKPAPPPAAALPTEVPQPVTAEEVFERCAASVVRVESDRFVGGGFFVSADGLTMTRNSVVAGSTSRKVVYIEGKGADRVRREAEAEIVAVDHKHDLALLKANVPRLVTFAALESSWGIAVGQELVMIDNPPAEGNSLDHSMKRGEALAIDFVVDGFKYIQTVIPLSQSSVGIPLFSKFGKVIGITVLKETASKTAALAIPAVYLQALVDGRETVFGVRSFGPGGKIIPRIPDLPVKEHPQGIKVDGLVTRLVVEDDRIVGLDQENHGLIVASISKRKVVRRITTGPDPTDFQFTVNPDIVWVGHSRAGTLVKVDVEAEKIFDRVTVTQGFDHFVCTRNHLWTFGRGNSGIITLRDKEFMTSPVRFGTLAWDRRRDLLVGLALSLGNTKFIELDPDKVGPLMRDIHEIKHQGSSHPRYKELNALSKEFDERAKLTTPPAECVAWMVGGLRFVMSIDRTGWVYANRSVLKRDKMDTIAATFPPEEFKGANAPGVAQALDAFGASAYVIQAGSPDGRWVATGTHIFSTEKFTMHKELPIPTPASAFSGDSKTLYIYDLSTRSIIPVEVESK